ncbi:MAG: hypothetical protein ABI181_06700 [Mycobacteriaceae bacterium]
MSSTSAAQLTAALEVALRKSAVVWLTPQGEDTAHPTCLVWAVFSPRGGPPGTLFVACGGTEQRIDGLVDGVVVDVVVARPGARSALTTLRCTATLVEPDGAVTAALVAARRNAHPGWTEVFALDLFAAAAAGGEAGR